MGNIDENLKKTANRLAKEEVDALANELLTSLKVWAQIHRRTGELTRALHMIEEDDNTVIIDGGTRSDYTHGFHPMVFKVNNDAKNFYNNLIKDAKKQYE